MNLNNYLPKISDSVAFKSEKSINKAAFDVTCMVPCVFVENSKQLSAILSELKPYLLRINKFHPVVAKNSGSVIYLDKFRISDENIDLIELLKKFENEITFKISNEEIKLSYDNFSADEIFKAVLPKEALISGFSHVGHIIHLNLKEPQLEYKHFIGQVLLDKTPKCKTVINKSENIEAQYRNFSFELLAGESYYITRVRENRLTFDLDYSKVFWNPRLSTERERLIEHVILKGDLVFDVFAGVGPFSVAAAVLKQCRVFSNDLNPHCVEWLKKNIRLNKAKNIDVFNLDGAEFLTKIASKCLLDNINRKNETKSRQVHFIMNLPAIALDFLKYFVGLLNIEEPKIEKFEPELSKNEKSESDLAKIDESEYNLAKNEPEKFPKIFIHCYFFCKKYNNDSDSIESSKKSIEKETTEKETTERIQKSMGSNYSTEKLGSNINIEKLTVDFVRKVAPNKDMMRASFVIGKEILYYDNKME